MQRRVRARMLGCIAGGRVGADEDVTEQQRHAGGKWFVFERVERERQHVGGSVLAHVLLVEHRHLIFVDEPQRQFGGAGHAFVAEYGGRQRHPTRGVDRYRLFVDGTDRK